MGPRPALEFCRNGTGTMDKRVAAMSLDNRHSEHPPGAVRKWLALLFFLGASFAVLAVFCVWLRIQQVHDGYRLARLQAEHEQALAVQRKLRLEWSQLHDPVHLEQLGREQLGLNPPKQDQRLLMR